MRRSALRGPIRFPDGWSELASVSSMDSDFSSRRRRRLRGILAASCRRTWVGRPANIARSAPMRDKVQELPCFPYDRPPGSARPGGAGGAAGACDFRSRPSGAAGNRTADRTPHAAATARRRARPKAQRTGKNQRGMRARGAGPGMSRCGDAEMREGLAGSYDAEDIDAPLRAAWLPRKQVIRQRIKMFLPSRLHHSERTRSWHSRASALRSRQMPNTFTAGIFCCSI